MHRPRILKLVLVAILAAIPVVSSSSEIAPSCPGGFSCPDVYAPVTCSNGVTYSNACYAALACATDCVGGDVS